jgi:hypothetical protein
MTIPSNPEELGLVVAKIVDAGRPSQSQRRYASKRIKGIQSKLDDRSVSARDFRMIPNPLTQEWKDQAHKVFVGTGENTYHIEQALENYDRNTPLSCGTLVMVLKELLDQLLGVNPERLREAFSSFGFQLASMGKEAGRIVLRGNPAGQKLDSHEEVRHYVEDLLDKGARQIRPNIA